jgi:hypothetical protein
MSKQTAVEWLQERLLLSLSDELKSLNGFFVIAKEMEKEQIKDAYAKCYTPFEFNHIGNLDQDFEQYYNKTYKNKDNV